MKEGKNGGERKWKKRRKKRKRRKLKIEEVVESDPDKIDKRSGKKM